MKKAQKMLEESIWIVDESRLNSVLTTALREGKAAIHDGVAYWAEGSGRSGIIQHLPFKEVPFEGVEKAIQAAQAATCIATAVSTGIILAAIVVQTRYLASKIEKVHQKVDEVAKDIHAQNIIFYMEKISDYAGQVETGRTLLKDRDLAREIQEPASSLLVAMTSRRNQILSFIENILSLANSSTSITPKHFELIVSFVQLILDLMPYGIHVEYLLAARIGKTRLAEQLLADAAEAYNVTLERYRRFMNELHRNLVRGQIGERKAAYQSIESQAVKLFNNKERQALLAVPDRRAAIAIAAK